MKLKTIMTGMGMALMMAVSVNAATIESADGVLSIETPSEAWVVTADPHYWFAISDGTNSITIDHLSNGEKLPETVVAGDDYAAVYQAFVSTKNEVFVVKGAAVKQEDLPAIMDTIGTIKVLKYDTKTAIQKSQETATASQFGLNAINAVYYVATDELNVRTGCSVDDHAIGVLYRGEEVTVNGAVTKDGADYGWYQIQYMGSTAYVSAAFLSSTPVAKQTEAELYAVGSGVEVYTQQGTYFCELVPYSDGRYYREEIMEPFENFGDGIFFANGAYCYTYDALTRSSSSSSTAQVQCEYCGEWFNEGADYRNHVMAAHSQSSTGTGTDKVQCEYCGEWFEAGNDYRNHVMAAHSGN